MKKLFTIAIFFSMVISLQSQELSEILENYYEVNGQESLSALETRTVTGRIFQMGSEFSFVQTSKRPNLFRLEADIMGQKFIQAFNGTEGWMVAPFMGTTDPQDIPVDQLKSIKREADFDGLLYNYEEKGIDLAFEGIEDLEGSDVYKIKATYDDGDESFIFIDLETYVILKTEAKISMMGTEAMTETFLSNYKMIDGTAIAFSIETKVNGQVQSQINIDSVEYGKEVDNSIFERPVKE